jgi:predicted phage terminase large subunit-like protein
MDLLNTAEFDAMCRVDLYTFAQRCLASMENSGEFDENWHIEMMASALCDVAEGRNKYLLINLPPRGFKSMLTSVAYVAWSLGRKPSMKFIVVSYGMELADKLSRDCLRIMQSPWYKRLFSQTRLGNRCAAHDFETTAGGGRIGVSMGGAITGRGADCIIIDDPIKPDDVISLPMREHVNGSVSRTLISRLNKKKYGSVIFVGQRLHPEDLSAKLIATGTFKCIVLPAIAIDNEVWRYQTPFGERVIQRMAGEALHPEREPLEALDQMRAMMGRYDFEAQYQQSPIPVEGAFADMDACPRYDELPEALDYVLQSWDTATKDHDLADYTVCTTWGVKGKTIYLIAVDRQRMDYPRLKERIALLRARDQPRTILIEDAASGQALIQELRSEGVCGVVACKAQTEKAMRFATASSLIASGRVLLPKTATWLAAFLYELNLFPYGRHDDQVDSVSQAINYLKKGSGGAEWVEYIKCQHEAFMLERSKHIFSDYDSGYA